MTNTRFLRFALKLDSIVTAASAAGALVLSQQTSQWLGIPAGLSIGVGIFLLVFAVGVWLVASAKAINPAAVWSVIGFNVVWVAASAAYAFGASASLTVLGLAYVIIQAAGVALFADLEFIGLRKAKA